ncbi:MAG: branched chain amino acid aminotransferase [Hadesarchaea archaeon]|nr:MAG: branched chain amino acid aminotransferase [Hadesarchaea archaeon]HDI12759.1 branched-chain amino acid transaminase [Hadesarchaea archaeon]
MGLTPTKTIWMNGEFVPWKEANVHVLTHTLHYGLGVFEGIRCYRTSKGPAVFRLRDHMERMENSAKLVGMKLPYSTDELVKATKETIRANEIDECYIRPIAFYGYGVMGLNPKGSPVNVAIAVWPWGTYLGEEGLERGIRAKISPWIRIHPRILPPQAKLVANYANSIFAKVDALESGYDEAILLNLDGYVAEGPGENVFMVKNGELFSPPVSSGALVGITRDSIIKIARDEGIKFEERNFKPEELYAADEAFFTGTAAEVTPIREVDGKPIGDGKRGPLTEKLQRIFFNAVRGKESKYESWLDYVESTTPP